MSDRGETPNLKGIHAVWFFQVVRVRLRFLLIVVSAGIIVGQWQAVRSIWDRWTWTGIHKHASGSVSPSHEYFCPMDPGIVSVWPAVCPICNMDLVPRKKMDAVLRPEGVVARMQLSPYRVQLAGIKTAVVQPQLLTLEKQFTGVVRPLTEGMFGFEVSLSQSDVPLFRTDRPVQIRSSEMNETVVAMAHLIDETNSPRLRIALEETNSLLTGRIVDAVVCIPMNDADEILAVPESAVVDRGRERLVYVETMPGLFDGVCVELGRRCGGYYPVTKGLKPGQRVAFAGAFLIDAESRLNPSLAAGYFGASQNTSSTVPVPAPAAIAPSTQSGSPAKPVKTLAQEDQALVDKQRICPVTELPLNSMGGPIPILIEGRKIFICCAGCERRLKDDPAKYLARLPSE